MKRAQLRLKNESNLNIFASLNTFLSVFCNQLPSSHILRLPGLRRTRCWRVLLYSPDERERERAIVCESPSTMQKADDSLVESAAEGLQSLSLREYRLSIRGVHFLITEGDIERLQSGFLTTLLDPESRFAQPEDCLYSVDADPECFSAFLHQARYGVLLPNMDSSKLLVGG
jgi:hypothetical protein